jgi:hypothetical protein
MSKIKCRICGKMFVSIFPSHLKSHGFSLPEYQKTFPDAPYQSEELAVRRSRSASRINVGRILSEETKRKIAMSVLTSPKKLYGEKHPKWDGKHKSSFGFGLAKRDLLKIVKECQGSGCRGNSNTLIIHHKDEDRANNDLDNLKVLCVSCHKRIHGNAPSEEIRKKRKHWPKLECDEFGRFKRKRRRSFPQKYGFVKRADRVFEFIKKDGITQAERKR